MILLYHVNMQTGKIGKCSATARQCPFGNSTVHYVTPEDARAAYEKTMASEAHKPQTKRGGFYRPSPPEELSGPTGYHRALHASAIPGATIKVTKKTLLGSHRYRFIQRGSDFSNRGWLRICDETKKESFVSSRDFVKEFFHAKDYKIPKTIELKRGVSMELRLPRLQEVTQWLSEGDEGPMVKHYSDEPEGILRRKDALDAWEKAVSLSQKGVRSAELRNWLLRAYEELDSRDRPGREHLTSLLRPNP